MTFSSLFKKSFSISVGFLCTVEAAFLTFFLFSEALVAEATDNWTGCDPCPGKNGGTFGFRIVLFGVCSEDIDWVGPKEDPG